jgi:hypothetical protein
MEKITILFYVRLIVALANLFSYSAEAALAKRIWQILEP